MLFGAKIELDLDAIAATSSHTGDAQNPDRWMLHQAANDGFRGLFLVCFDGPSAANGPRGLVVLSNGDNDAMLFNCAMARAMLEALDKQVSVLLVAVGAEAGT